MTKMLQGGAFGGFSNAAGVWHTQVHLRMHVHTCLCLRACMCENVGACMHACGCMHACMRESVHACVRVYTRIPRTCMCDYAFMCVSVPVHIHARAPVLSDPMPVCTRVTAVIVARTKEREPLRR